MPLSDLERGARRFADAIQHLLNTTVASGASIRATTQPEAAACAVAVASRRGEREVIELPTADPLIPLYLNVHYLLGLDDEGTHLAVRTSTFRVQSARDALDGWFHYDFERNKAGYPEAHLQVLARHDEAEQTMRGLSRRRKRKQFGELHFPVGGRRFRPALEDLIQFLVDEELVVPKDGWEKELERSRREFREIQLRAAIRRDPDVAKQALEDLFRR